MKKLIIILSFFLISILGYSQATNVGEFRIANATTAFGSNLPVGTKVYNIATGQYWVATSGVLSTLTLTTGSASFTLLNGVGVTNLSEGTATTTTVDVNSDTGTNATLAGASTTRAGVMTKAKFDEVVANNAKVTNVSTALSTGTVNTTTYGITSDGGADDIVLASATNAAAGVATAAQITKLEGIATGAQVNYTLITEKFEEASATPTAHSLSQTAQTSGATVSLNGAMLDPADYTLTSTTITIGVPVLLYDRVVITYNN